MARFMCSECAIMHTQAAPFTFETGHYLEELLIKLIDFFFRVDYLMARFM
jgi:hypothetical protein